MKIIEFEIEFLAYFWYYTNFLVKSVTEVVLSFTNQRFVLKEFIYYFKNESVRV